MTRDEFFAAVEWIEANKDTAPVGEVAVKLRQINAYVATFNSAYVAAFNDDPYSFVAALAEAEKRKQERIADLEAGIAAHEREIKRLRGQP
jgi:hypothetical protein